MSKTGSLSLIICFLRSACRGAPTFFLLFALVDLAHADRSFVAGHVPIAENCDALDEQPIHADVDFFVDVQPLVSARCAPCHIDISSGGMNLRPENIKASLLGADETGAPSSYPGYFRLRPGEPLQSLVFLRLNCANAGDAGNPIPRMPPPNGTGTDLQALVHDWIALGAILHGDTPETTTDRIFLGRFDVIR